jgi:hypothetical protein
MDEIKRNDGDSPVSYASAKGGKATGGPGGKKGFGEMTAKDMVARYLESDTDKDGKLSKEEISKMDERAQQRFATADVDNSGFIEEKELNIIAASTVAKMKARGAGGGGPGGGGFGGGRRGNGGGDGGPPNGGPAGGGE